MRLPKEDSDLNCAFNVLAQSQSTKADPLTQNGSSPDASAHRGKALEMLFKTRRAREEIDVTDRRQWRMVVRECDAVVSPC